MNSGTDKKQRLRSALRDNLKKRKQVKRKLSSEKEEADVTLRRRELSARDREKS